MGKSYGSKHNKAALKALADPKQHKLQFAESPAKNGDDSDESKTKDNDTDIGALPPELARIYADEATAEVLLAEDWDLRRLNHIVDLYGKCAGNQLWDYWNKAEFTEQLGLDCMRYSDNFIDPPDAKTWEETADELLEESGQTIEAMEKQIDHLLDYRFMADAGTPAEEEEWKWRKFLLGIAETDPLMIFDFNETIPASSLRNRYWDKSDDANPTLILRQRPLSIVWLLTMAKFEFPWADSEANEIPATLAELEEQEQMEKDRRRQAARDFLSKKSDATQKQKATMNRLLPVNVTPMKNSKPTTSPPSKKKPKTALKSALRKSTPSGPAACPGKRSTAASSKRSTAASRPRDADDDDDPPAIPGTYKEATQLPARVLTDDQQVQALIQTDLSGMIWETVCIFDIAATIPWRGIDRERALVEDRMALHIRKVLGKAMRDSPHKLALLPMSDQEYKTTSMWIKTQTVLDVTITGWEPIKPYVDCSGTSNGYWFFKKPEEARPRTLRTRIRCGFNAPPDVMRPFLNHYFQVYGEGLCFISPIQNGRIMFPGCLPYYPLEMDTKELARHIMREFNFKIPIAIVPKWPSDPGQEVVRKWYLGDDPRFMHVVCPWEHGAHVGDRLSDLFSLNDDVPKNQYPWGSPCQYIHDAKLCRQGYLNLPQMSTSLRGAIGRQLDEAKAFWAISEVIRCPIRLTGMYNQAVLAKFGDTDAEGNRRPQSLLKILWSIKCDYKKAKTAAANEREGEAQSMKPKPKEVIDMDAEDDEGDATEDTSALTGSSFSSNKRRLTERERAQMRKAAQKLLANDVACKRSSPLFTHIVPSEETGIWLFTCRKKYAALARQVLKSLPAFLIFHLMEDTVEAENAIFRKWMDMAAVEALRSRGLVWNPQVFRAESEVEKTAKREMDLGLSFLPNALDEADLDEIDFDGRLQLDLQMADVKAIDEGATIMGILNEARRLKQAQEELSDAYRQIDKERNEKLSLEAKLKAAQALLEQQGLTMDLDDDDDLNRSHHNDRMEEDDDSDGRGGGSAESRGGTSAAQR